MVIMDITKNFNEKELTLSVKGRIDIITSKDLDKGVYLSLKAFVDKSSKKNRKLHKNTLDFANDLGLKV